MSITPTITITRVASGEAANISEQVHRLKRLAKESEDYALSLALSGIAEAIDAALVRSADAPAAVSVAYIGTTLGTNP